MRLTEEAQSELEYFFWLDRFMIYLKDHARDEGRFSATGLLGRCLQNAHRTKLIGARRLYHRCGNGHAVNGLANRIDYLQDGTLLTTRWVRHIIHQHGEVTLPEALFEGERPMAYLPDVTPPNSVGFIARVR